MIYTVTFNPSIDYIVNVDNFMTGVVNRTSKEIIFPGGKGINVSMVLKNLGEESTALGFMAGFTGDAITRLLQEKGVTADFIHVTEGLSRINVKLRAQTETEINGQGPNKPTQQNPNQNPKHQPNHQPQQPNTTPHNTTHNPTTPIPSSA